MLYFLAAPGGGADNAAPGRPWWQFRRWPPVLRHPRLPVIAGLFPMAAIAFVCVPFGAYIAATPQYPIPAFRMAAFAPRPVFAPVEQGLGHSMLMCSLNPITERRVLLHVLGFVSHE